MSGFAPIFSRIVRSSLWREPDDVKLLFITMLALKDSRHRVMESVYGLGITCWPGDEENAEARALAALGVLIAPDTKRRLVPQPFDGRRVEEIPGGWLILNGDYYQMMMQEEFRLARQAACMREKRDRDRKRKLVRGATSLAERNAVITAKEEAAREEAGGNHE
jgi:hypothetical protein